MQNPAKVRGIFSAIASRYDLANHLLSGGLDFLWRAKAVRLIAQRQPRRILDLATGSGDLGLALTKALPQAQVVGADFCLPMLQVAAAKGLRPLVVADGTRMPFADNYFDAITVAFGLRNMESWPGALQEMARVLRPGGHLLLLDFSMPRPPFAIIYRFYLHRILPHLAGFLTNTSANPSNRFPPVRPCSISSKPTDGSPPGPVLSLPVLSPSTLPKNESDHLLFPLHGTRLGRTRI